MSDPRLLFLVRAKPRKASSASRSRPREIAKRASAAARASPPCQRIASVKPRARPSCRKSAASPNLPARPSPHSGGVRQSRGPAEIRAAVREILAHVVQQQIGVGMNPRAGERRQRSEGAERQCLARGTRRSRSPRTAPRPASRARRPRSRRAGGAERADIVQHRQRVAPPSAPLGGAPFAASRQATSAACSFHRETGWSLCRCPRRRRWLICCFRLGWLALRPKRPSFVAPDSTSKT